MALFFLLISFFFTLFGCYIFFEAFFVEENASKQMVGIMGGIGMAVVPYLVGKSLSEMVAIRQRHLMLEQTNLQQQIMLEAMEEAAKEYQAENNGESPIPAAPTAPPVPPKAAQ